MSSLILRIENHSLYTSLSSAEESVNRAYLLEPPITIEELEYIDRLLIFINLLKRTLHTTEPLLISQSTMNQLNQYCQHLSAQLDSFNSNRNIGHLQNADSYVEQSLPLLSQISFPFVTEDVEGMRESIISFKKSVGQHSRHIQDGFDQSQKQMIDLENKINQTTVVIETQKTRIDDVISQAQNQISLFQQQFSDAQEKRLELYSNEEKERTRIHAETITERHNNYMSLFNEAQSIYNEKFKLLKDEYDLTVQTLRASIDEIEYAADQQVKSIISALNVHKEHVDRLVGLIADTGMAAGFQKVANKDKNAARVWNSIVVLSLIGLIGFAVYAFIFTTEDSTNFSWSTFAGRVFVAGTFGVLATYGGRQVSLHQASERLNRKMELELTSIDSYLASLPEDMRHMLKGSLADRLFGQEDSNSANIKNQTPQQTAQQEVAASSMVGAAANITTQLFELLSQNKNKS